MRLPGRTLAHFVFLTEVVVGLWGADLVEAVAVALPVSLLEADVELVLFLEIDGLLLFLLLPALVEAVFLPLLLVFVALEKNEKRFPCFKFLEEEDDDDGLEDGAMMMQNQKMESSR